MDKEQRIAFVNAQTASMLAEMHGMIAENQHRANCNEEVMYRGNAFAALPDRFGISHNAVLEYLLGE